MAHMPLVFDNYPGERLELVDSGLAHLERFGRFGELNDINKVVECMTRILALTPDDDPGLSFVLINLGTSHSARYERTDKLDDIEKGIEYLSIALTLTPDANPTLAVILGNLGKSYNLRFGCLNELDDLEKAIEYSTRALVLTPQNHTDLPSRLNNLGACYDSRFRRMGKPGDLEKAIEYVSIAFDMTPENHPEFPPLLNNLGTYHGSRFELLGELRDLEKAIDYESRALNLTPDSHPHLACMFTNLGKSYGSRFGHSGKLIDLEKAIECESRALVLTPNDHPDLPHRLMKLGWSHGQRFDHLGELADLEKLIECESRALILTPPDHPSLRSRLLKLGASFLIRFRRLGELNDLERAIEHEYSALALTPCDHPKVPFILINLGASHNMRFERLGELGDLEKGIECGSRALSLASNDHPHLAAALMNLGASYGGRFQRLGDFGDLDRAIECHSRALALIPADHPNYLFVLMNLGRSYNLRFARLDEVVVGDLEKAIEYHTRALATIPDGHSPLPSLLESLGVFFNIRFRRLFQLDDIENANTYALCALALTPDGHPDLPKRYHDLGRYQFLHSLWTSDHAQFQNSMDSYRKASRSMGGAPKDKFVAALDWADIASKYNSSNCIEAYQTAIDLLPQFIWLGATANQRYQDLDMAKDLAVNAASAAILSSDYVLALEWLEHARCVVWSQNLMLRSPLDWLRSSHPSLAARLQIVADRLRTAGSESRSPPELASNAIDMEQAAQQHRRLAQEYNEMLSEVRKHPGFEEFLRPMRANSLTSAARNGPIVVVNCNTDRCDALLIPPEQNEIYHLHLPTFNAEKARVCRSELEISLRLKGIRERGVKARREPPPKDCIETVLATLWYDVVKPVLEFLGAMDHVSAESLPHVTWCPTGALSFLPLHAAGDYDQPGSRVFDYIISSYTPTLTALLNGTSSKPNRERRMLAIGQEHTPGHSPLPGTTTELAHVESHTQDKVEYTQLKGSQATTAAVLEAMEQHDWVHLACHAHQNVKDPTKSGFFLHDGILDLASISHRSFKDKGLAFLSACQTATGDESLPDESIHLASGMLMAGYTSVIATMWSVHDTDAPLVAEKVYCQLMKVGTLGNGEAGRALHDAITELRRNVGEKEFGRWVPYIHIESRIHHPKWVKMSAQHFHAKSPEVIPPELRTREWFENAVCKALGYEELKPWQLDMIISLCSGKDGFLTVATGQGKSTLIQGPIVADLAAGIESIGITLVPTKCLADDQARSAMAKGIRALALHEDTIREARESIPSRDLFEEVANGEWSLIFIGPEMIMSPAFDKLLRRKSFITRFRYFTVDEVHLLEDWNEFRASFNNIPRLRNRFLDSIVWLALSATISKGKEARRMKENLGFGPGTRTIHLPVDRPYITYVPRFIKYSFSGDDFFDLAWVIPRSARQPRDIPITIIFIEHIDVGDRLDRFLTRLLPPDFAGDPKELIRLCNSVMSSAARARDAEALRDGSKTRILICTDTGAFGLDIAQVEFVVAVQPNQPLFRTMCQKIGRIRTTGTAIIYFKKSMSLEQTSKSAQASRAKIEPALVEFANATVDACPRVVNCKRWGEPVASREALQVPCCNKHNPQIDAHHSLEVAARRKERKARDQARQPTVPIIPRSTREFPPLDSRLLQPTAFAVFCAWRRSNWGVVGSFYGPLVSEHMLISDKMLQTLCKRLHICTTLDRFRIVLWNWEYLNIEGWDANLFRVVSLVLGASVRLRAELEKASLLPAKRGLIAGAASGSKRALTVKKEEETR